MHTLIYIVVFPAALLMVTNNTPEPANNFLTLPCLRNLMTLPSPPLVMYTVIHFTCLDHFRTQMAIPQIFSHHFTHLLFFIPKLSTSSHLPSPTACNTLTAQFLPSVLWNYGLLWVYVAQFLLTAKVCIPVKSTFNACLPSSQILTCPKERLRKCLVK